MAVLSTEPRREQFEPHNQDLMSQLTLTAFRQTHDLALWSVLTNLNYEWHLNTTSGWNEHPLICICGSSGSDSGAMCSSQPVATDPKAMSQTEISISAGSTATFPTSASCEDAAGRVSTAGPKSALPHYR